MHATLNTEKLEAQRQQFIYRQQSMTQVQDWLFIHLYFFHVIQCIICIGSVLILFRIDIVIFLVFLYNINNTSIFDITFSYNEYCCCLIVHNIMLLYNVHNNVRLL